MANSQREPTHVCVACGAMQRQPDTPFRWCIKCFESEPIPLLGIDTRLFPDNIIPEGQITLTLNNSFRGLMLMHIDDYQREYMIATREDLILLTEALKGAAIKKSDVIHLHNQGVNIKNAMLCYKKSPDSHKNINFRGEGFIYLGYSKQDKAYKIGLSKAPKERAKRLKVELLHTITADNMGEGEWKLLNTLHGKMAKDLIDTHGYEWFYLDDVDINYIKSIIGYFDGRFTFEGGNNG